MDRATRERLVEIAALTANDPLAFVEVAFAWGEGELAEYDGPDEWARDILGRVRDGLSVEEALRIAVASGHGIGKSALVAWVILWAFCTCVDMRGVITANTEGQLRTKTQPELSKWANRCLFRPWYTMTATALISTEKGKDRTWRVDFIPWSETNTEAFAGLHNKGRRILLVFDEASAIADVVWEVAEGALTDADTEILWLVCGNATRNTGRFHECWGKFRHRWSTRRVDSRTVKITNKVQIAEWIEDYGVDSNFVRVRVRGEPPHGDPDGVIPLSLIEAAVDRNVAVTDVPPIWGVDVARFGKDRSALCKRQGNTVLEPVRMWRDKDGVEIAGAIIHEYMSTPIELRPSHICVDTIGVGAAVVDPLRHAPQLANCGIIAVNVSESKPRKGFFDKLRDQLWFDAGEWFRGLDVRIPNDPTLIAELAMPRYTYVGGKQKVESKNTMLDAKGGHASSPDAADALIMTFAIHQGAGRAWGGQRGVPIQTNTSVPGWSGDQRGGAYRPKMGLSGW